jgi:tRNA threonylcarbamoyladenosine biosynthesis protein TsaB
MESARVLCDLRVDVPASHAPRLLTLIHQALRLTSAPLNSIDLFAASQGPGSFTGLRIGIATLMGLGHALQRDVVGIDSLEALAMKAWSAPFQVGALLDARKGEVFGALFRATVSGPRRVTPNLVMSPEAFCAKITEPTLLLGTGVEVYRGVWERHLGNLAIFAPPWLSMPCSVEVGALAFNQASIGHGGPRAALSPIYVRPSEAEINWSRRHTHEQWLLWGGEQLMETEENALIEHLKQANPEFRQLTEEHLQYERRLEEFNNLRYLTSQQELEKKQVQKMKLRGKDRMAEILKEHKSRLNK